MLKHEHIVGALATAFTIAQHSPSERRKVGAVVIARDAVENRPHILGWGANGMPTGHQTNCCEIPAPSDYVPYAGDPHAGLATHPDVVHAERRALRQAGDRAKNAIVVCTDTPCPDCMSELNARGISQFYYMFDYRLQGHLADAQFEIIRIEPSEVYSFLSRAAHAFEARLQLQSQFEGDKQ